MLYSIKKEHILAQAKTEIPEKDSDKDKKKTIEATISSIEKQFGKGSIMRLDDDSTVKNVSSIPTGSIGLVERCFVDKVNFIFLSYFQ